MGVATTLALGALASLVASLVFWFGVQRVRPKLLVSEQIARTPRDGADMGTNRFRFKIVNQGRRAAVDLQVMAFLDSPRKVPGGEIRVMHQLKVQSTPGTVLPGRRKSDRQARHARRVRFVDDLDNVWLDDQKGSIIVRVYARDGSSGYVGEYERRYELRRCIIDGSFEFGDSMKIVQ